MRRLIREGNPPSGQLASPVPQYWNPSTGTFEDVLGAHGAPRAILYDPNGQPIGTQTNPLDVRVRELEAKLDVLKQTIESGVQLKGRDVEVVTVYDALAITDTGDNVSTAIDTGRFKHFSIMARSSHNAPVNLRVVSHAGAPATRGTFLWVDGDNPATPDVVIPSQQDRWHAIHTHPAIERFIQFGLSGIRFNATAMPNDVPTQGSLTLQIWGVPN